MKLEIPFVDGGGHFFVHLDEAETHNSIDLTIGMNEFDSQTQQDRTSKAFVWLTAGEADVVVAMLQHAIRKLRSNP